MHKTIQSLNQALKLQSDIDLKTSALILELSQKIKELSLKYKTQISTGTSNIQKNFADLSRMRDNYKKIKTLLNEIVCLQNNFSTFIRKFDVIKSISIAHFNFEKVVEMHRRIEMYDARAHALGNDNEELNAEKDELNAEKDELNAEKDGGSKSLGNGDLWSAYLNFLEMDDFRLELKYFVDTVDRETYINMQPSILNLDKMSLQMYRIILQTCANYSSDLLTKIDVIKKIVQVEENRDLISESCIKHDKTWQEAEILKIYPFYAKRGVVGLKRKICDTIVQSIQNRFRMDNSDFSIDNLEFVFSDLLCLEKIARKCGFLGFLFFEYHANLKILLDEKKGELGASEILGVLEFVGRYKDVLENIQSGVNDGGSNKSANNDSNFNLDGKYCGRYDLNDNNFEVKNLNQDNLPEIVSDVLNKPLIDKENEYRDKYIFKVSEKLKEWVQAIVDSEIEKFYSRETAPDEDENKKYISPGFINLLQIIKEQLEPISFDKTIFKLVTTKIIILAENFRGQINGAMENDLKKSYQLKSKPGYEEYAIMFGNSGLKLAQYANSLPECQNIEVKALGNIFIDVLKKSNQCLTIFVLKTCQPITDQIFTDSWYFEELHNHNENYSADGHNSYTTNTNPDGHNSYTTNTNPNNYANGNSHNNTPARTTLSKRFAVTIEDFLSDYFISMSEYSFVTFLYELASEIVGVYVRQLSRRRAKIRTNCRNCLLRDFRLLKMVFKKYGDDEIANNLNLIHRIGPIVEASSLDLFLTELRIFRADFPDLKKDFAKNLVKKRIDLEEGEKRVWIDGIKKVFED